MLFQFVISQKSFAISDILDLNFFYLNSKKNPILQLKMDIDIHIINLNVNALFSEI
jgi:hypothetical protein